MKHPVRFLLAALLAPALALPMIGVALAHPEREMGREAFPGEGVVSGGKQHGDVSGHLPARQENVALVGKGELSAPGGGAARGRVADVSAHGNHAYLTSFRRDNCLGGGAWVVDISDPSAPREVAFLPTTNGSYAGEGSQVITPAYGAFAGKQLFLHQNETCDASSAPAPTPNQGGINIWDVTRPESAQLLVKHAGDTDGSRANPNTVHSMFAWNSHLDQKVYAALVDNAEFTDVDIMDITDPRNPTMVNDTLDLWELFGVEQTSPPNLTSVFNHDMTVSRMGERYVMNVNYWDGGYVLLDVTDPRPGQVGLIAETDYAALDEERLQRGHEISPEGNAHQSEFSPDFKYLIGTDEDFGPYRVVATITGGPYTGTGFSGTSASGTPPVSETSSITGTPTFVGDACGALPAGSGIALVERGTCSFQTKLDNITNAGYTSGLLFNSLRSDCQTQVTMLASGSIPFLFLQRLTGLQILGVTGITDPCATPTPATGSAASSVNIEAVFDGWGYVRLFRAHVPREPGTAGSLSQIDTYAIPESQDARFARGFGDLSVHEVAMDPRHGTNLAYLSHYSGGFRVVTFGKDGLQEVGAFIDEGGNNFWGVEVHKHPNGQYYVLASDRDHGLYVFQYTGKIPGGNRGSGRR